MPMTQEDLLEEVAAKLRPAWPPGAFTVMDMANKMGWSRKYASSRLDRLVKAGELARMETIVNKAMGNIFYKPEKKRRER